MPPLIRNEREEEYSSDSDLSEDEWHPLAHQREELLPEQMLPEEILVQNPRIQTFEDFIAEENEEERNFMERARMNVGLDVRQYFSDYSETESDQVGVLEEQSERLRTEEQDEEEEERGNIVPADARERFGFSLEKIATIVCLKK